MDNLEVKIEAPEGFEIDRDNSTIDCIRFKKKAKALSSWGELPIITGWCVSNTSSVCHIIGASTPFNRNVFVTEDQADACLALSQLTQLLNHARGGWVPDWKSGAYKYCIYFSSEQILIGSYCHAHHLLSFETEEKRDEFLLAHGELIRQAMPLL